MPIGKSKYIRELKSRKQSFPRRTPHGCSVLAEFLCPAHQRFLMYLAFPNLFPSLTESHSGFIIQAWQKRLKSLG
jgi:hypothetical protein